MWEDRGESSLTEDEDLRNGEQEDTVGGKMALRLLFTYVWTRLKLLCEYETENAGLVGTQ